MTWFLEKLVYRKHKSAGNWIRTAACMLEMPLQYRNTNKSSVEYTLSHIRNLRVCSSGVSSFLQYLGAATLVHLAVLCTTSSLRII